MGISCEDRRSWNFHEYVIMKPLQVAKFSLGYLIASQEEFKFPMMTQWENQTRQLLVEISWANTEDIFEIHLNEKKVEVKLRKCHMWCICVSYISSCDYNYSVLSKGLSNNRATLESYEGQLLIIWKWDELNLNCWHHCLKS